MNVSSLFVLFLINIFEYIVEFYVILTHYYNGSENGEVVSVTNWSCNLSCTEYK